MRGGRAAAVGEEREGRDRRTSADGEEGRCWEVRERSWRYVYCYEELLKGVGGVWW